MSLSDCDHDWEFDMGPNYEGWWCSRCHAVVWGGDRADERESVDELDDTYEPQEACGHYAY